MYEIVKLNFQELRMERQKYNNQLIVNSIKNNDEKSFYKNINRKEYDRLLTTLEISHLELWKKCQNDILFSKLVASNISKKASRQGSKDEFTQINICNQIAQKIKIKIEILNKTAYRPTKDGKIISFEEMKKENITKDKCLKSFDAKISGKINGWISAKITFGSGGHQDNVFEEEDTLCLWWKKYIKNIDLKLVILIDTNLKNQIKTLKEKYNNCDNILITNHYHFQEYLVSNYIS